MGKIVTTFRNFVYWLWFWSMGRFFGKPALAALPEPKAEAESLPEPVRCGWFNDNATFVWKHPTSGGPPQFSDPWEVQRRCNKFGGDNWGESIGILRSAAEAENLAPSLAAQVANLRHQAFRDLAQLARNVWDLPTITEAGDSGWNDAMAFILMMDYLRGAAALGSEFLPLPKQLA